MTASLDVIDIDPRSLVHLPTANPNVMEPHVFEKLCAAIKKHGFLQPVLVVKEGDAFVLIDGVHRCKAATEVGLATVSAVVCKDRKHAELLRIAMNKMRGELDLSEVGRQLQLLLDTGFEMDEVELTGFAEWEINSLVESMNTDDEALLDGVNTAPAEPTRPKQYNLTIKYETETERARVREALESLGEGSLVDGISMALDAAVPDWRGA